MTQNKAQQRLADIEKEVGIVRQKLQGGFLLNLNPLNLLEKEKQGILLGIEETKKENEQQILNLQREIEQLKEDLQIEKEHARDQQKIFWEQYYPPEKAYKEGYEDAREKFERY